MKLKKLELFGFKSFVDKMSIGFPPGISAIVGPNGCGKSNVVDALRWVMGEQSVKQLRGKAMEDVIFAGADGRPPLNMAEVTLTLVNDNGTVPEEFRDFSEIQVTRRLYRSGESAYLLNRNPCRLKDIHNLFMGSGMGAKTYAVIQQGSIGAITDAGPEERRLFIEEAAGITRYKARKTEALRKVTSTRQNLLRVSDIISEVQRQMNGMKRQAKKAERFKRLQEKHRSRDIQLCLMNVDQFADRIAETDRLLTELKDTDLEHSSQLRKLDAAVEDIKMKRWQKDQAIAEQKSRRFDLQRQTDRLESDVAHLRQDVERLGAEIQELETARTDIAEQNQSILGEMSQVEAEHRRFQTERESASAAVSEEREKVEQMRGDLDRLTADLEARKSEMMDLVAEEARYRNIIQNVAANKENLQRRLKRIDEERHLADGQADAAREKKAAAERELAGVQDTITETTRHIEDTGRALDALNTALRQQVKTVQTLQLEQKECRSRHATLKRMQENYEWYREGVREIMKRAEGSRDGFSKDTILGLTADVFDPAPSYETAVEAVLGEALQYVLVTDQAAGVGAIDHLQARNAGRGGFIPIGTIRDLPQTHPDGPDPDRRLLNHVTVQTGYEAIAQALLGHVVVCEDLDEALRIWNANGCLQTVVTKGGDVITHQGLLVGGSPDKLAGILTKKKEIMLLEEQMAALSDTIGQAEIEQERVESDVRGTEHRLHLLTEEKQQAVQVEMEIQKSLVQATEELKQAKRRLDIVTLEQEQLLGEQCDIDDQLANDQKVLSEIEHNVAIAQDAVAQGTRQVQSASEEMERYNQEVVDLRLQLTSIQSRLDNSENTLRRLKEFRDDAGRREAQVTAEIDRKHRKRQESERLIVEHKERLARIYETIAQMEQTIETSEADYRAIDNQLKENDSAMTDIRSRRDALLQKIRLLEIDHSQQQVKQDGIVQRLMERYGRSLDACRRELAAENPPDTAIEELEAELADLRRKIDAIGDVNLGAIQEYEELGSRYDFLTTQRDDLVKAIDDLQKVIRKINRVSRDRFTETFERINEKLAEVFPRLFEGGSARLVLTDPDNPLETGVEYMIHPPGKKLTRMSLLSGGEKAMAAIAFLFSIFLLKPASFCLMDEIDAPLDEANVFRFNDLLKIIGEKSQIILVTHNKRSMEFADTLFGITMERKGISKIVHVHLNGDGQSTRTADAA